jgi:hypothetical protein
MRKLLGTSVFVSQKCVRDQGLTERDSAVAGRNVAVA